MNTISVKCSQCGKDFLKEVGQINSMKKRKWKNHFCSIKCLSLFGNVIRKNKHQEKINRYNENPKKCLNCNRIIDYKDKSWKKYCSTKCSAIYTQRNGGHCHWTEEGKEKLRKLAKKNPNFGGWNKGLKYAPTETLECSYCKKAFIQVISKSHSNKTKICSKECRSKIQSINLKQKYKNGKEVYGGTTKWLKYKDIKVQGTYEYRVCIILDKWKDLSQIKNWEYTNDRFEYIGVDNKKHNYLMDFKIWNNDDTFYYLEVKGYEKENDKLKWESVREKGYKLEVWFDNDIKEKEFMATVA